MLRRCEGAPLGATLLIRGSTPLSNGTGTHGQAELDRRVVPDERDLERSHARGGDPDLRGAAARLRRLPGPRGEPSAPRPPLPAEAGLPAGRDGEALLGR